MKGSSRRVASRHAHQRAENTMETLRPPTAGTMAVLPNGGWGSGSKTKPEKTEAIKAPDCGRDRNFGRSFRMREERPGPEEESVAKSLNWDSRGKRFSAGLTLEMRPTVCAQAVRNSRRNSRPLRRATQTAVRRFITCDPTRMKRLASHYIDTYEIMAARSPGKKVGPCTKKFRS